MLDALAALIQRDTPFFFAREEHSTAQMCKKKKKNCFYESKQGLTFRAHTLSGITQPSLRRWNSSGPLSGGTQNYSSLYLPQVFPPPFHTHIHSPPCHSYIKRRALLNSVWQFNTVVGSQISCLFDICFETQCQARVLPSSRCRSPAETLQSSSPPFCD